MNTNGGKSPMKERTIETMRFSPRVVIRKDVSALYVVTAAIMQLRRPYTTSKTKEGEKEGGMLQAG